MRDVETGFYKRCEATQYCGLFAFPDMRVSNNANHIERAIAWSQSALLKSSASK